MTEKPIEHVHTDAAQHHAMMHNRAVLNTSIDDSDYQRLQRENAELRINIAEYEAMLGVRAREIKAALEDEGGTDTYALLAKALRLYAPQRMVYEFEQVDRWQESDVIEERNGEQLTAREIKALRSIMNGGEGL